MTAAGVLNPNSRMKEYGRQCFVCPSTLRDDLIAALRASRLILKSDPPIGLVHLANRQIVECKNQLLLLDAFRYGLIQPITAHDIAPIEREEHPDNHGYPTVADHINRLDANYSRPLQIEREDSTYTQEFDDYSDADPGL